MKTPAFKIGLSYLSFSFIYFIAAFIISKKTFYSSENAFEGFYNSINNVFYWAQAYVYFIITIILSAGVGTLYTQLKGYKRSCHVFRMMLIFSVLTLGIMLLLSNLQ